MVVLLFVLTWLLELAIWIKPYWPLRLLSAALVTTALPALTVIAVVMEPSLFSILLIICSIGRVLNMLRLVKGRIHATRLQRTTAQTSACLVLAQSASLFLPWVISDHTVLITLIVTQAIVAVGAMYFTVRTLLHARVPRLQAYKTDKELPTITVAIPARNETQDMADCLRTVLASNYPKLEVLVLDDCSQDRTPDIIKSFAHDGVRFIRSDEPTDRWLAKNYAYERLYQEATGEYILYCGVDVRFGPQAIRTLINTVIAKDKRMASVLPLRFSDSVAGAFIQPMRYWWELALPRRPLNRPPVLSTCWIIKRSSLKDLGGFAAVSRTIIPEAYMARELLKADGYSFLRASNDLDIRTVKSVGEQRATAVRVHYPQLHRRMELSLGLATAEVLFLLAPYVLATLYAISGETSAALVSGCTALLLTLTHVIIVSATNPANVLVALVSFPVAVLVEVVLGVTSMIRYEFYSVLWKGRNVCLPVMHVYPRLPPLDQ